MTDKQYDLCGTWQLFYAENRDVKKMKETITTTADAERLKLASVEGTVPGNFERDFERAGLIEDPYFGANTLEVQKLEYLHLWYCRTFTYRGAADENTCMCFEGIDTAAEIYLNGQLLKKVSNMFLTYEIPVPNLIDGENELVVHIIPAVIAAREYAYPVSVNAATFNYESLYIRKAPSMFGWDIMPRIVSGGIWKPVSIIQKKVERINDIFIYPLSIGDGEAELCVFYNLTVEGDSLREYSLYVRGICGDSKFEWEREIFFTSQRMQLHVSNAKLWWPKNAGEQNLYDVVIELHRAGKTVDTHTMRTGIRTVELSRTSTTDKDGNGDFCFIINGKRVFAMGTNWVPMDAFHANDINRIEAAVDMAVDLGCNIIRLWGGNVYEHPKLFDLCDEYGIMIWQDFSMACAAYPQEQAFLDMMAPEVEFVIKQYRNHPSLIVWAGDNECDFAFSWAGTRRNPNDNVITRKLIPDLLRIHDFTRPYLPSSPYWDEYAFKTWLPISEDHLWGPRDYFKGEYYKNTVCHFASETGYHGCPSPKSLEKFMTKESLWPIFEENGDVGKEWLVHAVCVRGDMTDPHAGRIPLMVRQVKTLFGDIPDNLDDFALMSQISQAEAKKYFIERFRITRGRRNGIIWWNLIDGWPQISDAIVDYNYCKKLAYHYIKRAQQPVVLAFDEPETDTTMTLYGINDTTKDVAVNYCVRCITDGTVVAKASGMLTAEKSNRLLTINIEKDEKKFYVMEWEYSDGETVTCGRNHFHTNLIDIDYHAYKADIEAADMLEVDGF